MRAYMLHIYVMKTYPPELREKFNALAEQLCISSITLGELMPFVLIPYFLGSFSSKTFLRR